ncbi:MAG TPA: glycoside hydrolase family 9 protein [Fimbriimonadaceae bacterium]|nr:glycoside hydrolase family 9 protein [Fimbriimonadaceae bacterium]
MLVLSLLLAAAPVPPIFVDQFGWRPGDRKVAVFADAVKGQNAPTNFQPGDTFEVHDAASDKVVYSGKLSAWQDGIVSPLAGDRVWHADFSSFKEPGKYTVVDPKTGAHSYPFRIAEDVYAPVLVDAVRMFYYQRSGIPLEAKYAGAWTHPGGSLVEDAKAQFGQNGQGLGHPRNLLGGWYDAGDPNKYVPFLESTLFDLLYAYDRAPKAFGDADHIPESGNGVPDILDEVKWELDWVLKMQDPDGGVHNRDAVRTYGAPAGPWSADPQPRFYTAKTTWATAIAAASLAHAARSFAPFDAAYPGYPAKLKAAALKAWDYLDAHPSMLPNDGQDGDKLAAAPGEGNPNMDKRERVYAAAELFKTTGDKTFSDYVVRWAPDFNATAEGSMHPLKNHWVDALNHLGLTQGLFVYCQCPGADPKIVDGFKEALRNTAEGIRSQTNGKDDPYLNYVIPDHYCWGSNKGKGCWARILLMAADLDANPERTAEYRSIAQGYFHWVHGVNPLGWCFLTNMAKDGASHSVRAPFHKWFGSLPKDADGQRPLPPPGYLEGGPNKQFSVSWIAPPFGEPAMKAFKDWDGAWNAERQANEASWEITEPAIYYQAAYVLMLSAACGP